MNIDISKYKIIESLSDNGYAFQNGIYYDPDSSPETWKKVYKKLYGNSKKLNNIFDFKDFEKLSIKQTNKDKKTAISFIRLLAEAKNNINKCATYTIGGDTDFNFNFGSNLEEYCLKNNINNETKQRIKKMLNKKYCYNNFSLMLTTGGINGNFQGIKSGSIKFKVTDNICVFINLLYEKFYKYDINSKYRKEDNIIFKDAKPGVYKDVIKNEQGKIDVKLNMCSYLNEFTDIYDYCDEIYKIKDKKFVDKIIEFANKKYDDYNVGINEFFEIIEKMWEYKEKYLKENL